MLCMRARRLFIASVVPALLAGVVVCARESGDSAQAMLDAVNAQRRAHGERPLVLNTRLARAAAAHARDLVRTRRLDHKGSDGSRVGDRAERAGYRWSRIAENLAETRAESPAAVVDQWMRSRPHRANLLNGAYRDLGVAHQGKVWVIVLGRT